MLTTQADVQRIWRQVGQDEIRHQWGRHLQLRYSVRTSSSRDSSEPALGPTTVGGRNAPRLSSANVLRSPSGLSCVGVIVLSDGAMPAIPHLPAAPSNTDKPAGSRCMRQPARDAAAYNRISLRRSHRSKWPILCCCQAASAAQFRTYCVGTSLAAPVPSSPQSLVPPHRAQNAQNGTPRGISETGAVLSVPALNPAIALISNSVAQLSVFPLPGGASAQHSRSTERARGPVLSPAPLPIPPDRPRRGPARPLEGILRRHRGHHSCPHALSQHP